ncbi:MAG: hypothetical protein OEV44_07095 [Spirochaetota bacterium]|nr:hypothetical protein [Spirochaetota bacterium]
MIDNYNNGEYVPPPMKRYIARFKTNGIDTIYEQIVEIPVNMQFENPLIKNINNINLIKDRLKVIDDCMERLNKTISTFKIKGGGTKNEI